MVDRRKAIRMDGKTEGMFLLADAFVGGAEGAIERSEARGQRDLVASTQLPVEGTPGHYLFARERPDLDAGWRATGIVFGEQTDPLFRHVELPAGWRLVPSDHAMWSELVDDRGRKRAGVFYKAAFYDRKASIQLELRFTVCRVYDREARDTVQFEVLDCGRSVHRTAQEAPAIPKRETGGHAAHRELETCLQAECEAWLDERFPRWREYDAHWDD